MKKKERDKNGTKKKRIHFLHVEGPHTHWVLLGSENTFRLRALEWPSLKRTPKAQEPHNINH
jgi:hypothetical protein